MPIYCYILIGIFLLSLLSLLTRIGVEYRFAEPDRLTLRVGLLRKAVSLQQEEKPAKKGKKPAEKTPWNAAGSAPTIWTATARK